MVKEKSKEIKLTKDFWLVVLRFECLGEERLRAVAETHPSFKDECK